MKGQMPTLTSGAYIFIVMTLVLFIDCPTDQPIILCGRVKGNKNVIIAGLNNGC